MPELKLETAHYNRETTETVVEKDLSKYPKKKYEDRTSWAPMYECWRAKLEDIVQFHRSLHEDEVDDKEVIMNIDGVPIGRTGRSQTIVSLKFKKCRNVYQVVNVIPHTVDGKKCLTVPFLMKSILLGLQDLGLSLLYICADAPMRAFLRNQKSHSGKKSCDYCYAEAQYK